MFQGTWIKDVNGSDSMEEAIALLRLNGIVRTAIRLIKGIKLTIGGGQFEMAVFSFISWFKVVERYPMSGQMVQAKRRDLRRGDHTGSVQVTPGGSILLKYSWAEPYGGSGQDEFKLVGSHLLHVTTSLDVSAGRTSYTQVYRRKE